MKLNIFLPILAAGDDGIFGVIATVVVVGLWLIGAIASASKKKPQQNKQQPSWQDILRDLAGENMPQVPQQQQVPPPPPVPVPQNRQQSRPVQRPAQRPVQTLPPKAPPAPAPKVRVRPKQKMRGQTVRRGAGRPPAAPPPPPAVLAPAEEAASPITAEVYASQTRPSSEAGSTEAGGRRSERAVEVARWLKPGRVKQQFILTEVLQAPLALRDERR